MLVTSSKAFQPEIQALTLADLSRSGRSVVKMTEELLVLCGKKSISKRNF